MDFKFGVFLAIVAHLYAVQGLPPCVCTRNYSPICGSNGQTYSNECMLMCARFTDKEDITVVKEGNCDTENQQDCGVCPFIYLPVCGTDGVTYASECNLNCQKKRVAGLEMKHAGACESKVPEEPPCECTRNKKPVCGTDGATYSNSCLLNCATKDNSMLGIAHPGPCVDKVKVVEIAY